jgi:hypothetical protein
MPGSHCASLAWTTTPSRRGRHLPPPPPSSSFVSKVTFGLHQAGTAAAGQGITQEPPRALRRWHWNTATVPNRKARLSRSPSHTWAIPLLALVRRMPTVT